MKTTDTNNEVARLRKYIERLEIYSPENEWSLPEWRKLVGSKEQNEDPETLFNLYQFRLAPAPEKPDQDHLHAWMRLQESINKDISGELQNLRDEIQKLKQK